MNKTAVVKGVSITGPHYLVDAKIKDLGGLDYDPSCFYKDGNNDFHDLQTMPVNFVMNALIQSIVRAARESFTYGATSSPKYDTTQECLVALEEIFDIESIGTERPEIAGLYAQIKKDLSLF